MLLAVFVPTAFIPGITGRLYVQFAVTISVAVSLSSINALTLSPALCALLLKPGSGLAKRGPLHWFNLAFEKTRTGYDGIVRFLLRRAVIALVLLLVVFGGAYTLFRTLPTSFIPFEDLDAPRRVGGRHLLLYVCEQRRQEREDEEGEQCPHRERPSSARP